MSVREDRREAVLTLTIDRPDARNSLDDAVLDGLIGAMDEASDNPDVRVVVLTGAGERAFCAGADLASALNPELSAVESHDARGRLRELFGAIERLDKPLVGRVNGHAIAGGLGVALACDLLVTVDEATFGCPEVQVGLWPYMISALILEHLGPKRALELMMTGRRIDAEEAERWGLVNRVVPREELDDAVDELCGTLIRGAPLAMKLGRRAYHQIRDMTPHAALPYLHGLLDLTVQTEDVEEGVTAFLEKRDPEWTGR